MSMVYVGIAEYSLSRDDGKLVQRGHFRVQRGDERGYWVQEVIESSVRAMSIDPMIVHGGRGIMLSIRIAPEDDEHDKPAVEVEHEKLTHSSNMAVVLAVADLFALRVQTAIRQSGGHLSSATDLEDALRDYKRARGIRAQRGTEEASTT